MLFINCLCQIKEIMILALSVCLFHFLFVFDSKNYERILMEFYGGVGCGPDGSPDHDPNPGSRNFFTGLFIYCCDSCRQPRIKREMVDGGLNSVSAF